MIKKSLLVPSDIKNPKLQIPVLSYKKSSHPVVWLTACSHGDEVGGVAVIHEIFKNPARILSGSLYAFPMMNPIAFEKGNRLVNGDDLNRAFPGKSSGSVADVTANTIYKRITNSDPDLVIDIHNDWTHSIPYVILDPVMKSKSSYGSVKEYSLASGFQVVEETTDPLDDSSPKEWKKTLSGSLMNAGYPALVMEIGEARVINEENVKKGVDAVFRILEKLGMLSTQHSSVSSPVFSPVSVPSNDSVLYYSGRPRSSTKGGIIRFKVKPGDKIKRGHVLAVIYDVLGEVMEEMSFTEDYGVVLGYAETSVAYPDEPLIAIAVKL